MLLVASARISRRKQLRRALEELRQVDAPVLGSVLYRADSTETGGFGEEASRRDRRQARRLQADTAANAPVAVPPAQPDAIEQPSATSRDETG